ncbi:uncharacterized protein LOC110893079 [Helianthus annuus]|uniref:uncharacterized protein LOC110893079 n=1 Tax=Helianthus annuus TaxID=4232 RepID=UPI000B8FE044|nr:uncharacterized protein LOC110893079 [Helianthus annuus]
MSEGYSGDVGTEEENGYGGMFGPEIEIGNWRDGGNGQHIFMKAALGSGFNNNIHGEYEENLGRNTEVDFDFMVAEANKKGFEVLNLRNFGEQENSRWIMFRQLEDLEESLAFGIRVSSSPKPLRIFNSWLERKDFDEVVNKAFGNSKGGGESDVVLMQKFKAIREVIKKWKKDVLAKEGEMERTLKEDLEHLDELLEIRELSEEEEWAKSVCLKDLKELEGYRIKYLKQRARIRWDLEGDENPAFFHGYINSRRANNNNPGLLIDGVWTSTPSLVKKEILGFFKRAFKENIKDRPKLNCHNIKRLSEEEAASLMVPFRSEEIKIAVFECGADKAPGPDGFNFKFIKKYWNLFESDFSNLLASFYSEGSISEGCSSSFITLIPKNKYPVGLKDYRLINLIGVISKTISNILANWLNKVIGAIISENQTTFLKGRYILDSPLMLNELIAWIKKEKKKAFLLKIDFERLMIMLIGSFF